MMENPADFEAKVSFGKKIEMVIERLPAAEVALSEILDSIGHDSLLFLTIFLSLVFLIPVSIPGISTVFGSVILLIGISRLFNRKLWLPQQIASRTISTEKLIRVLNRALIWFNRLEKFSRPNRFHQITGEGMAGLLNKLSFILAAVLLMIPFGFIPLSNTLPAIALIFLALGGLQKDGGCVFFGHFSNLVTIIYFFALFTGGGLTMIELLRVISG